MSVFVYRPEQAVSPRHHASITAANDSQIVAGAPSMITLRDTSIRNETSSLALKDARAEGSTYFRSNFTNSGVNATTQQLPTTLIGANREAYSLAPDYTYGPSGGHFGSVLRDTGNLPPPPTRLASNRFLASGLDQRILKQSTEDCRRLLQQVCLKCHYYVYLNLILRVGCHIMDVTFHAPTFLFVVVLFLSQSFSTCESGLLIHVFSCLMVIF